MWLFIKKIGYGQIICLLLIMSSINEFTNNLNNGISELIDNMPYSLFNFIQSNQWRYKQTERSYKVTQQLTKLLPWMSKSKVRLIIFDNIISDLAGINIISILQFPIFTDLKQLVLSNNYIDSIENIQFINAKTLIHLDLSTNLIRNIQSLRKTQFNLLRRLDLRNNLIINFNFLTEMNLQNLMYLYIWTVDKNYLDLKLQNGYQENPYYNKTTDVQISVYFKTNSMCQVINNGINQIRNYRIDLQRTFKGGSNKQSKQIQGSK